jgi:hypothetical protein
MLSEIKSVAKNLRIPDTVTQAPNDQVTWKAENPDGKIARRWGYNKACYAGIMPRLPLYRITCRSFYPNHRLPWEAYQATMEWLRKIRIMPPEAEYWQQDGGNWLMIPVASHNRHTVFTILSIFRHCDCHAPTMYVAYRLFQKLEAMGVSYLQCLHYALGILGKGGHTFISMSNYEGVTGPRQPALNPALGWAIAALPHFSALKPLVFPPTTDATSTFEAYAKLSILINPIHPSLNKWNSGGNHLGINGLPRWQMTDPAEILHPQLAPLYLHPEQFRSPEDLDRLAADTCQRNRKPQPPQPAQSRSLRIRIQSARADMFGKVNVFGETRP